MGAITFMLPQVLPVLPCFPLCLALPPVLLTWLLSPLEAIQQVVGVWSGAEGCAGLHVVQDVVGMSKVVAEVSILIF